ncbi:MAG: trypsin-like peptidase domain-containing protein [FCB group bacterium]|nr:trypsin-like peptidase domain-containing protein [FCB group bacterium]
MFTYLKYFIGGIFAGVVVLLGFLYFTDRGSGDYGVAEVELMPDAVAQFAGSIQDSRRNAITNAVESASPAVVGINVTQVKEYRYRSPFHDDPLFRQFFPERLYRQRVENLGSGFVISPDGYVITNEHVVHNAVEIIVTMSDGSHYEAEIVGADRLTDVGLLKIDGRNLHYLEFWDSDDIIIGEWVIAIGNPFGLFSNNSHPTVTVGVISAVDRDFQRNQQGKLYQDMIQTDASINPGNSGGPLLNSPGMVVGMNTMIFSESGGSIGLGFAIPANKIQEVVTLLKTQGTIDRNFWIGISIQNVNSLIAMAIGMEEIKGVVVTDIDDNSPADKSGMEVTDVILALDGVEITDQETVQQILNSKDYKVGDAMRFTVYREGKTMDLTMELDSLPK